MNTQNLQFSGQASGGLTKHGRRQAAGVSGVDSLAVIVGHDVPEHNALNLCHGHPLRPDSIKFFFLQRRKKAFHPGVVIAAARAAHALNRAVLRQCCPKCGTGKLAVSIAVQVGRPESPDTQLLLHVVIHGKTDDLSVVAVQNCRQVQLAVLTLDLRNIRQPLPVGSACGKIPVDQVLRLLRRGDEERDGAGLRASWPAVRCFGLP